jgi:predicted RNA binding protein YcfA (HicA-like mRNA interferase family)
LGTVYTPDEIISLIKKNGWKLDHVEGSHHIFVHNSRSGIVVVPKHTKDLPKGTSNSILKQAGLK